MVSKRSPIRWWCRNYVLIEVNLERRSWERNNEGYKETLRYKRLKIGKNHLGIMTKDGRRIRISWWKIRDLMIKLGFDKGLGLHTKVNYMSTSQSHMKGLEEANCMLSVF